MLGPTTKDISDLYVSFNAPITEFECGRKCSPYNEFGVPFCCDTKHAIPTSYLIEWDYLKSNTNLWHLWEGDDQEDRVRLKSETPNGQIMIECLGHANCQRDFRSITCRAFPFFPYITKEGDFIGLAYYWDYEERCWVISNLDAVTPNYVQQFVTAYDKIFELISEEQENFRNHSIIMRRDFGKRKREISLLHRHGGVFTIRPKDGKLKKMDPLVLPKYGPYEVANLMPFPDEI